MEQERVRVSAENSGADLCLSVEDDGPGLTPDEREHVGERGERLDESVPARVSASPSCATSRSSMPERSRSTPRLSVA